MESFLAEWEQHYKSETTKIPLFTDAAINLTDEQRRLFVRLFYHARGHFHHFLWIMASMAPSPNFREVVLRNITDELGGTDPSHLSHEQLFFGFAEALGVDVSEEMKTKKNYMPFLGEFNEGHTQALLNSNWDAKWAIFAAYELLDNTDYENLYALATRLGVTGDALTFFDVHRNGDHFTDTFRLLQMIWNKDEQTVRRGFDFIGKHQLAMWQEMSRQLLS